MYHFTVEFLGVCQDETHHKCWGWVRIGEDTTLYNFWGGIDKKFTFKRYENSYWNGSDLIRLRNSKMRPRKTGTYVEVPTKDIEAVIPGFYGKLESELCMAKLCDKFHGKPPE